MQLELTRLFDGGGPAPAAVTSGWITTRPGLPYFLDEAGSNWTPIGANDAISWPELEPLFKRKDLPAVERHLRSLRETGVT